MNKTLVASLLLSVVPAIAMAQASLNSKQPVEIASDNLEVIQDENKAIFSGNVIAKQGTVTMNAAQMTVFYEGNALGGAADPNAKPAPGGKGIKRIESDGKVVFTTPEEIAQGDHAVYQVASNTIDLTGNVVLTRGENILKGSALHYDLTNKRSTLAAGSSGRVHGLFVPNKDGGK